MKNDSPNSLFKLLINVLLNSTEEQRGLVIIGSLLGLILISIIVVLPTSVTQLTIAILGFVMISYILGFAFIHKYS